MYKRIALFLFILSVFYSARGQTEITLNPYFRNLKSVKVNIGNKEYHFLFDSGAGISMVSPAIARELNKTVYGSNVGFRMSGEKVAWKLCDSVSIKIGGMKFYHPYVAVFDMMSLLPKELDQIDGIISLKTFENNKITLNLSENKIIVETGNSFKMRIKNMHVIPGRFANGATGSELDVLLGLRAHHQTWWFLFDTGNISRTKISKSIAKEWGLTYQENEITEVGDFTFNLAGNSIAAPTEIDNIIYDGALSFDFIQQSVFAISFKDEKIWMRKIVDE